MGFWEWGSQEEKQALAPPPPVELPDVLGGIQGFSKALRDALAEAIRPRPGGPVMRAGERLRQTIPEAPMPRIPIGEREVPITEIPGLEFAAPLGTVSNIPKAVSRAVLAKPPTAAVVRKEAEIAKLVRSRYPIRPTGTAKELMGEPVTPALPQNVGAEVAAFEKLPPRPQPPTLPGQQTMAPKMFPEKPVTMPPETAAPPIIREQPTQMALSEGLGRGAIQDVQAGARISDEEAARRLNLWRLKRAAAETPPPRELPEIPEAARTFQYQRPTPEALNASLRKFSDLIRQAERLPSAAIERIKGAPGRITPLNFQPDDALNLLSMIEDSPRLSPLERMRATNQLSDLFLGNLPEPQGLEAMYRVFGKEFTQQIYAKKPTIDRFMSTLADVANLPRAIFSSMDVSFPLRQGALNATANPKQWLNLWKPMLKSFRSAKNAEAAMDAIRADSRYDRALESGLDLLPYGDVPGAGTMREERFATAWAGKIPGIRQSERAYVVAGNKLRFDVFNYVADKVLAERGLSVAKEVLPAQLGFEGERVLAAGKGVAEHVASEQEILNAVATFVNTSTGRAPLPEVIKGASRLLNAIFFSPRFAITPFMMAKQAVASLAPEAFGRVGIAPPERMVRKEIWKSLAAFVGVRTTILGLLGLAGVDVELDPRSSDWGKAKFGDTHIDMWAGYQQPARVIAQVASGERKTLGTQEVVPAQRAERLATYMRTKFSPSAGSVADILFDKTIAGEPVDIQMQALDLVSPGSPRDIIEAVRSEGLLGVFLAPLILAGLSAQTFTPTEVPSRRPQPSRPSRPRR